MFYQEKMDEAFRFGDIIEGFVLSNSHISKPNLNEPYNINVNIPSYCAILSPCCSIGQKSICLTPLIKLQNSFFDNQYFVEDLTRINRKMKPEDSIPSHIWDRLPEHEKQKRLTEGYGFAFFNMFIYEKHDLFIKYAVNRKNRDNIETNFYMINFTNTYKVNCDKIISAKDAPLEAKLLQLSIQARSELRDKISFYYARVPKEDLMLED